MKLLRFGQPGQERPGVVDSQGNIRDLSGIISDLAGQVLHPESLQQLAELDVESLPLVTQPVRLGPCVAKVGKMIAIGLNYADHAAETGSRVPRQPIMFMKATSAICGPNDNVVQPLNSTKLDWEVELAVVIGRGGAYIDEADAGQHIAGYCICNDVSERAFQLEMGGQWTKGKGCDTFGPLGPWLVTPDEIADVLDLTLELRVNERIYQHSSTKNMLFSPAFLVSYVSQFMSLQAGDVICTGTPAGVGMAQDPPVFLQAGDQIRLSVSGLGEQRQTVVSYQAQAHLG